MLDMRIIISYFKLDLKSSYGSLVFVWTEEPWLLLVEPHPFLNGEASALPYWWSLAPNYWRSLASSLLEEPFLFLPDQDALPPPYWHTSMVPCLLEYIQHSILVNKFLHGLQNLVPNIQRTKSWYHYHLHPNHKCGLLWEVECFQVPFSVHIFFFYFFTGNERINIQATIKVKVFC